MRRLRWSEEARSQYRAWLVYLNSIEPALAARGGQAVDARALKIAARRSDGRPSRWAGLREVSLTDWHKLIVYQETRAEVLIVTFYDMRQDLSTAQPQPE